MDELEAEILQLLADGQGPVSRDTASLLNAGHRGNDIDDACRTLGTEGLANGIESRKHREPTFVLRTITEHGRNALISTR